MHIRRLTKADVAPYRELMLEAYAAADGSFISTFTERAPLPLRWWEERIAHEDGSSVTFGAFVDDVLAGTAGLKFEDRTRTRHKATLFGMYVAPAHRGVGLGKALIGAALDCARTREAVTAAYLALTEGNAAALALYEACGFIAYATEPMALRDDANAYRGVVHMWQRLR